MRHILTESARNDGFTLPLTCTRNATARMHIDNCTVSKTMNGEWIPGELCSQTYSTNSEVCEGKAAYPGHPDTSSNDAECAKNPKQPRCICQDQDETILSGTILTKVHEAGSSPFKHSSQFPLSQCQLLLLKY